MLFVLQDLLDNPAALLAYMAAVGVAIVTGIGFHEFSHAWAANQLGDDTAARRGRLTLNPLAHVDPMGMAMIALVGFGWGKPTPVNPYRLRTGPKRGNMMVAAAGPISNFIFAAIAALPLKLGIIDSIASLDRIADASGEEIIGLFLFFIIWINIVLGVFNLIPIHPLDGFKVMVGILPDELSEPLSRMSRWGPALLMGLIAMSFLGGPNPLRWLLIGVGDRIFEFMV